jgi:hypothetical protein
LDSTGFSSCWQACCIHGFDTIRQYLITRNHFMTDAIAAAASKESVGESRMRSPRLWHFGIGFLAPQICRTRLLKRRRQGSQVTVRSPGPGRRRSLQTILKDSRQKLSARRARAVLPLCRSSDPDSPSTVARGNYASIPGNSFADQRFGRTSRTLAHQEG